MSKSRRRRMRDRRAARNAARNQDASAQPEAATTEKSEKPPLDDGGSGAPYILPGAGLKNDRLERRAIRQRFPIKENYREPLVNRQISIAIDPNSSPKEATAAFRAVLVADLANMEQERRDEKIPEYHQHEHSGTVSVEQRREFFVMLGETLREFPDAKERVGRLLEERVRLNSEIVNTSEAVS